MEYLIRKSVEAVNEPESHHWHGPFWQAISPIDVAHFHARSSSHHPKVQVKMTYSDELLMLFFQVHDRYVKSVHVKPHDPVCTDSCVEFFVHPKPQSTGYFNFEVNLSGTIHLSYITDPTGHYVQKTRHVHFVEPEMLQTLRIATSHPGPLLVEHTAPMTWWVRLDIPLSTLEKYTGPLGELEGQRWRANFYKCADRTSHPHWASWSPIGEALNFHQPRYFGHLFFCPAVVTNLVGETALASRV